MPKLTARAREHAPAPMTGRRLTAAGAHRPGDSDPNPDEALRRARAAQPGGAR
ncbi:hypothetical protein [Streptomyces sp. NPDC088748]|uniref:hypothetical protein n=1 Tax=Streptomyces sp. NPDC088748 TaxID=3365887 RepID=UPI0038210015